MGNTQSTRPAAANYVPPMPYRSTSRSDTSSPVPGFVHKSMRTKKRSLELPDFEDVAVTNPYSLHRGRSLMHANLQKSASIPIPMQPNGNGVGVGRGAGGEEVPVENGSEYYPVQPSTHMERVVRLQHHPLQQQQQPQPPQPSTLSLITPSGPVPPPPTRNPSTVPLSEPQAACNGASVVVRSTIPLALPRALDHNVRDVTIERVGVRTVKISWHGGGQSVYLEAAGDDDVKVKQKMKRDPIDPTTFSTTVILRPGKHYLRFLVDDQWRVADDLPTAVDNQGSLANFIDISPNGVPTTDYTNDAIHHFQPPPPLSWEDYEGNTQPHDYVFHPPLIHPQRQGITVQNIPAAVPEGGTLANLGRLGKGQSFWSASSTGEHDADSEDAIHQHIEHAGQIEAQIAAAKVDRDDGGKPRSGSGSGAGAKQKYVAQWTTDIPLELFEAAREEEKYLAHQQELILQQQKRRQRQPNSPSNGPTQYEMGFVPLPNIPPAPGLPRYLDKLILNTHMRPVVSANMTQAPAAVTGSASGSRSGSNTSTNTSPTSPVRDREARRREREKRALNAALGLPLGLGNSSTSDVNVASPTTSELSSTQPNAHTQTQSVIQALRAAAFAAGTDPNAPTAGPLPVTTASGTDVTTAVLGGVSIPVPIIEEVEMAGAVSGAGMGEGNTVIIDDMIIADDASVLPVPSHVVLHHLCTSAIKNGVLAVGETVRYRKKYLTTIYYKPT